MGANVELVMVTGSTTLLVFSITISLRKKLLLVLFTSEKVTLFAGTLAAEEEGKGTRRDEIRETGKDRYSIPI